MKTTAFQWRHLNERRYTWVRGISNLVRWPTLRFMSVLVVSLLMVVSPVRAKPDASLLGTYWLAVEIDGTPVNHRSLKFQPLFILKATEVGNRVQGFTGCNELMGSFEQSDNGFRFKALTTTRQACFPPWDALERAFLQALEATTSVQLSREILELKDATGRVRMRLKAANPVWG